MDFINPSMGLQDKQHKLLMQLQECEVEDFYTNFLSCLAEGGDANKELSDHISGMRNLPALNDENQLFRKVIHDSELFSKIRDLQPGDILPHFENIISTEVMQTLYKMNENYGATHATMMWYYILLGTGSDWRHEFVEACRHANMEEDVIELLEDLLGKESKYMPVEATAADVGGEMHHGGQYSSLPSYRNLASNSPQEASMEDTEAAANVDARSSDADSWSFETNEKQDLEDLSVTLCERQARNPVALKEDRNSSQQQMRRRRLLAAEEITNWLENKENNDLLLNEEVSVMMSAGVSDSSVSQRGGEHLWDELRSVSPSSVKDSMPSLLIHGSRTSKDFCAASVLAGQTFAEYQMLFHDLLRMDVLSAVDFQTMIHDTSDKVATVLQSIIGLWIEILNGKNLKPLINACWFMQGVYGADAVYVIQDTESCGIIALECQHFLHPQQIFDKNAWTKFKQEEALTMIKKGVDNLKYNGIIFNESFNVEATEEVFMSSLDRQLMECIWKLNKYHKTQLQALRGMKCFSSSLSKKWSRKFPQMQDIKCICHGPGRHRITCGCMDEKFIHLALQDFSYTLLCVESYDPMSYIDAMKSFVQHQKLNIEKLEEGFCEFYSLRESDSVRHPSSVEGMGLPGSPGMAYSVKAICPLHTVAYRLECMDVAERAIKHFRTVGFSGSVFADVQYPHYAHAQIDPVQRWLKLQLNIVQQQFGFLQKRHVADTAKLSGILTQCGLPSWLFLQSKGQSEQQENTTTAAKVNQVFFDEPKQTLPRVKEKELQRKNLLKSKSLAHQSQEDGTTTHKPRSTSGKCYKCGSRNHKSPFHRNCPYYGKQ